MIWAIWKPRSFIEHNFQTAAQVFINSEGFIDVAVLWHPTELGLHAGYQSNRLWKSAR